MKKWIDKYPPLHERSYWKKIVKTFKYFLAFIPVAGIVCVFFLPRFLGEEKIVLVERGQSLKSVAQVLEKEKLIIDDRLFTVAGRIMGLSKHIQAGEYLISPLEPPYKILRKLARGEALLHKVVIPEGSNLFDIASALEKAGVCSGKEFLKKATDRKFLQTLGIKAASAEGFLFPDTYYFRRGTSPEEVISRMVDNFRTRITPSMKKRLKELGFSLFEIITLASIIEKETSIDKERPLVSAVFHNRLKLNMPLQADPTVIYGLKKFGQRLRKADLRSRNPYNTYIYRGLPPGPICNPGLKSIHAALYPADADYLYFVSKNDGTHDFSRTLREHNRKVYEYQIKPYLQKRRQ